MTFDSPIAPLEVRQQFMTDPHLGAGSFLDAALRANPYRDQAYLYEHRLNADQQVVLHGYSLVDVAARRDHYARWYHANGVQARDVIGIYVGDGVEPLFHYLALAALGAIPAMINDAMAAASAKRYLVHIGAVGLVCDDTTALAAAFRADPSHRPRFIASVSELKAFDASPVTLPTAYPFQHRSDDVVALIHSSGTTGVPKSTMLAHRQFWVGKEPRMLRFPAEAGDRLMCLMPHTHAGGLSYFMTATLLGLPMVAMSDWRRSTVEPVMRAFEPTMVASFPRTFVELATGPLPTQAAARVHSWFNTGDGAHHAHVRRLVQLGRRPAGLTAPWLLPPGAAPARAQPGSQFIDGLGSSEMGMALFGQASTPQTPRADRCIGRPIPIVEKAAVLNEEGEELPDGQAGMLGVKTPTRTPGYWNDPAMTRRFELNGYWLTGDVVRKDADGNFYHLDRTVDVIDTLQGPVYSLPMEEVLLADCAELVIDCAVVGVPAADGRGQAPVAVLRLQPGVNAPPRAQLLALLNAELKAASLTPLAAVVIAQSAQEFPTGVTGKVLKRELRTRLSRLLQAPVPSAIAESA